jgi:Ca-activated chloride channel homolog
MRSLLSALGVVCLLTGCGAGASGAATPPAKTAGSATSAKTQKPVLAAAEPDETANDAETASRSWIGAATPSSFVLASSGEQKAAIWVDAPKAHQHAHVPTALTLTIDTSGSMRGDKIAQARQSALALVDALADGDVVTIHTFSDSARVRVPATVLSAETRRTVRDVIEELDANGGTNLFDALNSAEAEIWRADAMHPVRRVVLISDGKATVGATDPQAFARLADTGLGQGVQISAFGVGLDYDEHLLDVLAERSSGRLYHIGDASQLASVVDQEMKLIDSTAATDAFVEVVPAPGVRILGFEGAPAAWQGHALRVPIGTLYGGQSRELVLRFAVDERKDGQKSLFAARLSFHDPADGGIERVQEAIAKSTITGDESLLETGLDSRAQSIIATHRAALFAATASTHAGSGDFAAADRELARAQLALEKSARAAKPGKARERTLANAQRMKTARKDVQAAARAPAPARAAASRARSLELNDAFMDMNGY